MMVKQITYAQHSLHDVDSEHASELGYLSKIAASTAEEAYSRSTAVLPIDKPLSTLDILNTLNTAWDVLGRNTGQQSQEKSLKKLELVP